MTVFVLFSKITEDFLAGFKCWERCVAATSSWLELKFTRVESSIKKVFPFNSCIRGLPLTTYLPFIVHHLLLITDATHFRSTHMALIRLTATVLTTVTRSAHPMSFRKGFGPMKSVSDISRYRYIDTMNSLKNDIKCSKGSRMGWNLIVRAWKKIDNEKSRQIWKEYRSRSMIRTVIVRSYLMINSNFHLTPIWFSNL